MTVLSKLDKLNKRLKLVAVAFFPLTVVSIIYGWYFRGTVERYFLQSDIALKPAKLFRNYSYAGRLVGLPYRIGKVDIDDRDANYNRDNQASVYLPVRGSVRTCYLQAWSSREEPDASWEVDKMDLTCDDKIWTIYINPEKRDVIHPTVQAEKSKSEEVVLPAAEEQSGKAS